jgi:hypothetical protein
MGNRLLEGRCIMCGMPVIAPNSWGSCSQCAPKIKEQILALRRKPGSKKKLRIKHGR